MERGRRRPYRTLALLVGLVLTICVLPGPALAEPSKPQVRSTGSWSPASIDVVNWCRTYYYFATNSTQVAAIQACVERLPGGVRAYFGFSVSSGTANFKGTLWTCSDYLGCRKSRDFWLQGVGQRTVGVATAWDTSCPVYTDWYGFIRLLDIRFLPSGELHAGTGPYRSDDLRSNAC
jgi:hypothetical protein